MVGISCYSSKQSYEHLDEQHEIVLYDRFLQRRGDRFKVPMIPLGSFQVQRSIDEVMQECQFCGQRYPAEMRHLQNRDCIAIAVVERNSTGRYQNRSSRASDFRLRMPTATVSKGRLAGQRCGEASRCVAELLLLGVLPEFRMLGLSNAYSGVSRST